MTDFTSVGDGYRGIMEHAYRNFTDEKTGEMELFIFPGVAETFNGYLNDQSKFAVTPEHIIRGVNKATADRVPEGNTGGGTAMLCHQYKGGTGSSSRTINGYDIGGNPATYTVGVLVQVNYSSPENLHVGGIPLGRILKEPEMEIASLKDSVGLGKVGGYGRDIFLAFSTANKIAFQEFSMQGQSGPAVDRYKPFLRAIQMSDNDSINCLFEAAADVIGEAIYNRVCMAGTMTAEAIDLDKMKEIVGARLV
ncbi:hypothetical protein H633G_01840 [Metarhizium anisopliae BRIP 53284]|nr:hypothetical protein H633G_01840 [Metarhizium anisopliae BRIP 53284]